MSCKFVELLGVPLGAGSLQVVFSHSMCFLNGKEGQQWRNRIVTYIVNIHIGIAAGY